MINEHPLLASYANIFVILFTTLKTYSKYSDETTYSWKVFLKILDLMISKILRDLSMNQNESIESDLSDESKEIHSADH
jgi:hypothetical protein